MVNAGRILLLAKGEWSNLVTYEMLDIVTYNMVAYLARQSSVGVNPENDTSLTYWQPFGTAKIATTTSPGLVMPDGQTITVDNTGLIQAVLGVDDLSDVNITSLADGETIKYDSASSKWVNVALGTAASKDSTNAVTQASTDLVESGAVYTAMVGKEDAPTILTQTLSIGSTYVTFNDASITTSSILDVYADLYGIAPTDITVTTGQAVLTFEAQTVAVSVKLFVR